LPLLHWLDEVDPAAEAIILLGKRNDQGTVMAEFIEESPHYGDRKVWFPLINFPDEAFYDLISQAGFIRLDHRSLECDPCVNSRGLDLARLSKSDMNKTKQLEKEINKTLFEWPIEKMVAAAKQAMLPDASWSEMFDMGCGSPFACGE